MWQAGRGSVCGASRGCVGVCVAGWVFVWQAGRGCVGGRLGLCVGGRLGESVFDWLGLCALRWPTLCDFVCGQPGLC